MANPALSTGLDKNNTQSNTKSDSDNLNSPENVSWLENYLWDQNKKTMNLKKNTWQRQRRNFKSEAENCDKISEAEKSC